MVRETYTYQVTIPAGTQSTAPQTTAVTFPTRLVRWVEMIIPPGPAGNVGFRVASNGTQQIPVNAGSWIIRDNYTGRFDFETPVESGAWQVVAYNTGVFPHTIEITFGVDLPFAHAGIAIGQPLAL